MINTVKAYKTPVKILASLFRAWPWPLRSHSGCATVIKVVVGWEHMGRRYHTSFSALHPWCKYV